MVLRLILAGVVCVSLLTACSDRFRDPCGYVREAAPTTIMRTKNKALGWVPTSTTIYGSGYVEGAGGPKCG